MELQKRKRNRLENYDYSQNGAYFITICVKDRKEILSKIKKGDLEKSPSVILTHYGNTIEKFINNVSEIEKYVIMPDHIHMIIRINNGSMWASTPTKRIGSIVRSIKTLTTKEIGETIFQRSFYDHIIRNEKDYVETMKYIENNPIKYIISNNP